MREGAKQSVYCRGVEYCRNCGKQSGLFVFALPGLCTVCHTLPSITAKYNTTTGELLTEPAPKHDGILDEFGSAQVRMREHDVLIQDIIDEVELDAAQALSLLAWLKQEEANLQKLVEEEEEKQS